MQQDHRNAHGPASPSSSLTFVKSNAAGQQGNSGNVNNNPQQQQAASSSFPPIKSWSDAAKSGIVQPPQQSPAAESFLRKSQGKLVNDVTSEGDNKSRAGGGEGREFGGDGNISPRLAHLLIQAIGLEASVSTTDGSVYNGGVLHSFNAKGDVIIQHPTLHQANGGLSSAVEFLGVDRSGIVDLTLRNVNHHQHVRESVDSRLAASSPSSADQELPTDTDIATASIPIRQHKTLVLWSPDDGDVGDVELSLSTSRHGGGNKAATQPWDQFQAQKEWEHRHPGQRASTFNDDLSQYTVSLDKSDTPENRRLRLEADRIASEIEKLPESKRYDEAGNQDFADDAQRFSDVDRQTCSSIQIRGGPRDRHQRVNNSNFKPSRKPSQENIDGSWRRSPDVKPTPAQTSPYPVAVVDQAPNRTQNRSTVHSFNQPNKINNDSGQHRAPARHSAPESRPGVTAPSNNVHNNSSPLRNVSRPANAWADKARPAVPPSVQPTRQGDEVKSAKEKGEEAIPKPNPVSGSKEKGSSPVPSEGGKKKETAKQLNPDAAEFVMPTAKPAATRVVEASQPPQPDYGQEGFPHNYIPPHMLSMPITSTQQNFYPRGEPQMYPYQPMAPYNFSPMSNASAPQSFPQQMNMQQPNAQMVPQTYQLLPGPPRNPVMMPHSQSPPFMTHPGSMDNSGGPAMFVPAPGYLMSYQPPPAPYGPILLQTHVPPGGPYQPIGGSGGFLNMPGSGNVPQFQMPHGPLMVPYSMGMPGQQNMQGIPSQLQQAQGRMHSPHHPN